MKERRSCAPPSMSSKSSLPTNRTAANFGNVAQRPPMGMSFPRPPMTRPPGTSSFSIPGSHVAATAVTGSSGPPPGSDNVFSVSIMLIVAGYVARGE
ncbi:hypothetical protein BRARA_H01010 [Brassica rapa]|uniref:Uncharacterized protein n=1 Tax=Brassica campestris TaxID=3711 RepID=A0A397YBL5_BRACM|nr:hypothetical protein BRARA_H01010 [Brassica rapa]